MRLSIRYGIVTPYTSYLVTEELPLGAEAQQRIAGEQFSDMQAQPSAPASGQSAVEKAAEEGYLAGAGSAVEPMEAAASRVRILGGRAFLLADGVWFDTAFDPDQMNTVKVAFLSADYFALAQTRPELGAAFALRGIRPVEANGWLYRALGVRTFGALLRRTRLRLFNVDVYLRNGLRDAARVGAELEAAEASHFWAAVLVLPYMAYLVRQGAWTIFLWFSLAQLLINVYPIMHLRLTRHRLGRAALRASSRPAGTG